MVSDCFWWLLMGANAIGKWEWMEEVNIPNDSHTTQIKRLRYRSDRNQKLLRLALDWHLCMSTTLVMYDCPFCDHSVRLYRQFSAKTSQTHQNNLEQHKLDEPNLSWNNRPCLKNTPPLDFLKHHVYLNCRKKNVINYKVLSTDCIQTIVELPCCFPYRNLRRCLICNGLKFCAFILRANWRAPLKLDAIGKKTLVNFSTLRMRVHVDTFNLSSMPAGHIQSGYSQLSVSA